MIKNDQSSYKLDLQVTLLDILQVKYSILESNISLKGHNLFIHLENKA